MCTTYHRCDHVYAILNAIPVLSIRLEPQRQKTNPQTCAPSDDSDQPAHSCSLIRIFTVAFCIGNSCAQRRVDLVHVRKTDSKGLIRLGGCPDWSVPSLSAYARRYVLHGAGPLINPPSRNLICWPFGSVLSWKTPWLDNTSITGTGILFTFGSGFSWNLLLRSICNVLCADSAYIEWIWWVVIPSQTEVFALNRPILVQSLLTV